MSKLTRFTIKLNSLKGLERDTETFDLRPDEETRGAFSKKLGTPDYDRIIFQSKRGKSMVEYDYEGYEWRGPKLKLYLGDRTRMI